MSRTEPIHCKQCGKRCGTYHPARLTADPDTSSPAEQEGLGEDYVDSQGNFHCSQRCLTLTEHPELICEWCGEAVESEGPEHLYTECVEVSDAIH